MSAAQLLQAEPPPSAAAPAPTWDAITKWQYVLPPNRPAHWQLLAIRAYLSDANKDAPVAILGSTPEFRDLLFEMGFTRVHVLEANTRSFRQMTELRCHQSREILFEGDWLQTLGGFKHAFAAILSDLTSGNMPYERRQEFYHLIAVALMPGGVFIDKILTHPIPHDRVAELRREFVTMPLNIDTANRFASKFFFCSELLDRGNEVDPGLFCEILEPMLDEPPLRRLLSQAGRMLPPGCRWWYGRPWAEVRKSYFAALRGIRRYDDRADSPYARRCRLYFLRAR